MLSLVSKYSFPLTILLLAAGWLSWKWYHTPGQEMGTIAPDFVSTTPTGDSLKFSNFKGKIVLLDFWASWCGPCRRANPEVVKLYSDFHGKVFKDAADFEVISISFDKTKENWMNAIQKDGLIWPWHGSDLSEFDDHVGKLYKVRAIPAQYLIDTDGKIMAVNPESQYVRETLTRRLAKG
jgi:thiol-disulfide isomerase/thioredoxin